MNQAEAHVALLIDFENLVFGLQSAFGDGFAEWLDPELLMRLAEESGQVVVANAYADWRSRDLNQFQTDLYRLGIELVHVLGRKQQTRFKNAVDVKMAVDAVETLWTLPHVKTFVIVSGDRDFIHVLKTLRRHGKTVVGVSPDASVSEDFASLCDRFVRYGALRSTLEPDAGVPAAESAGLASLQSVREALRALMTERPGGLKGAQVKPLLRRRLSVTFDESEYGFSRLTDMLLALPEVVTVVPGDAGGDITVLPARSSSGTLAGGQAPDLEPTEKHRQHALAKLANLSALGFDASRANRRTVLEAMFRAMREHEPFTLEEMFERAVREADSAQVTITRLSKYQTILWQSRAFVIEKNQHDRPVRERLMRLAPSIFGLEELVQRYEYSVAYKLAAAAKADNLELTAEDLAAILGHDTLDQAAAYLSQLRSRLAGSTEP